MQGCCPLRTGAYSTCLLCFNVKELPIIFYAVYRDIPQTYFEQQKEKHLFIIMIAFYSPNLYALLLENSAQSDKEQRIV